MPVKSINLMLLAATQRAQRTFLRLWSCVERKSPKLGDLLAAQDMRWRTTWNGASKHDFNSLLTVSISPCCWIAFKPWFCWVFWIHNLGFLLTVSKVLDDENIKCLFSETFDFAHGAHKNGVNAALKNDTVSLLAYSKTANLAVSKTQRLRFWKRHRLPICFQITQIG